MNTESMGTGMSGGPGGPGVKIPIYELAKELGILNKDLVTKIHALGIEAKNHMSRLEPEDAARVRRSIDKERQENTIQERLSDTVIRRRAKDGSMLRPPPTRIPAEQPRPAEPVAPMAPTGVFVRKRSDSAQHSGAPFIEPSAPPSVEVKPAVSAHVPAGQPAAAGRHVPAAGPVEPSPAATSHPAVTPARSPIEVKAPAPVPTPVIDIAVPPPVRVVEPPPEAVAAPEAPVKAPPAEHKVKAPATAPAEAPSAEVKPHKGQKTKGKTPGEAAAGHAPAGHPATEVAAPAAVVTPASAVAAHPLAAPMKAAATSHAQAEAASPADGLAREVSAPEAAPRRPEAAPRHAGPPQTARPQTARAAQPIDAAASGATAEARAPLASAQTGGVGSGQLKTFVTAQTRRTNEGLGPTGRVIDLAALRPQQKEKEPPPPQATRPAGPVRGPREEVTGERLRQMPRPQQQQTRPQQKMRPQPGKKSKATLITTAAEHKRVVKMAETIAISELARQMGLKATDVLKKIWELGMRSVMINSPIDFDTAQLVSSEFEWRVESTAFQETSVVEEKADLAADLLHRAPVITIMGHVDHGKTSLLDAIRNANVAGGEAGGITQHIGAYKVTGPSGDVVFLDTPGHEAFTEMRARGAQATDIVVLVVAADDGVMPQTLEALNHAKDAKVPIIVAVNKIDKAGAQPERIRQQLSAHGLQPEEWGGETIYADVSARTKVGLDRLLEMLALQAEVLELKANPNKPAKGLVIEARMDAKRGPVATILVQEGTLRIGDSTVVGEELGKVRAMVDYKGQTVLVAGPSTPVEILGLSGVPRAGDVLNSVTDERAAKELVEHRRLRRIDRDRVKVSGPVKLEKLMDAMKAGLKDLKIILKADVQGSVEALAGSLVKLSTEKVKVTIIQSGVGGITENDVNLAKAGNAVIIGFHVRPAGKANSLAEQEGVDIKLYDIIYEALDDVKKAMAGLLAPVKREKALGKAEVRQVFNIPKIGTVAGVSVTEGLLRRNAQARLVRDSVQVFQGRLASLRRFKDDVREVEKGYECGTSFEGYNDLKEGDVIEAFEIEEIAATLS